jgi:hypothetical protein
LEIIMQRKRQYALVNINQRELVKDRRGKLIISKTAERAPPLPPGYSNYAGHYWAEIEIATPRLGHGQEFDKTRPTYTIPDPQKQIVLCSYAIKETR